MQKRGQSFEHVVVYVMVAIIAILTLFFGYQAFESGKQKHEDSTLIQFETSLNADLESVKRNLGSFVHKTYVVPTYIEKVCVHDDNCGYVNPSQCWDFDDPIIDEMLDEDYNVFLVPFEKTNRLPTPYTMPDLKATGKVYVPDGLDYIEGDQGFYTMCFPVNNGRVDLLIGGGGSETIIRPVWSVAAGSSKDLRNIIYCEITGDIIYETPSDNHCWDELHSGKSKDMGLKLVG